MDFQSVQLGDLGSEINVNNRLRVFKNRVLRIIFGSKVHEVTQELRKFLVCTNH
jgi:hypothetical protein